MNSDNPNDLRFRYPEELQAAESVRPARWPGLLVAVLAIGLVGVFV